MTAFALPMSRQKFDLPPAVRIVAGAASAAILLLSLYALLRWMLGFAPATPWVKDVALAVHLGTVIPAIPLGAYVILARKGGSRHKSLGKIWLALMFVTAFSTLFIRNINAGNFSWIHLLTLLTFVAVPQAILTARQGRIEEHKKHLRNFFFGSLIIAGITAFAPGRTMWQWAFASPVAEAASGPGAGIAPDARVRGAFRA